MDEIIKSCCVTGHRDVPAPHINYIKAALAKQVDKAIEDGFLCFYSGFAIGSDLWFADIVAKRIRAGAEISLIAAIPHRSRYDSLIRNDHTRAILNTCEEIRIFSDYYRRKSYFERNQYMVDLSERVIAVYDGRKHGGTYSTVMHAKKCGREIIIINRKIPGPGDQQTF